jgi:alpha/beta hydrolase fold
MAEGAEHESPPRIGRSYPKFCRRVVRVDADGARQIEILLPSPPEIAGEPVIWPNLHKAGYDSLHYFSPRRLGLEFLLYGFIVGACLAIHLYLKSQESKLRSAELEKQLSAAQLRALQKLGIERPVLIGHSLGGEELSSIGSRHPERISALIYLEAGYSYAYYDSAHGDYNVDLAVLRRELDSLAGNPIRPEAHGTGRGGSAGSSEGPGSCEGRSEIVTPISCLPALAWRSGQLRSHADLHGWQARRLSPRVRASPNSHYEPGRHGRPTFRSSLRQFSGICRIPSLHKYSRSGSCDLCFSARLWVLQNRGSNTDFGQSIRGE